MLGLAEGASDEGKKVVSDWHSALENIRPVTEKRGGGMRAVLVKLPEDGPAKTLLGRLKCLNRGLPRGTVCGVLRASK